MADHCLQILVTLKAGVGTDELAQVMNSINLMGPVHGATVVGQAQASASPEHTHVARKSGFVLVNRLGTVEERFGSSPLEGSMLLILLELQGVVKGSKTFWELLNTHCPEVWTKDRVSEVSAYYSILKNRIKRREKELGRESRFRLCEQRGLYGLEREYATGTVVHDAGYARLKKEPAALLLEIREDGLWTT